MLSYFDYICFGISGTRKIPSSPHLLIGVASYKRTVRDVRTSGTAPAPLHVSSPETIGLRR